MAASQEKLRAEPELAGRRLWLGWLGLVRRRLLLSGLSLLLLRRWWQRLWRLLCWYRLVVLR